MKIGLLISISLFAVKPVFGQPVELPSDPLAGRLVLEGKGCLHCHALGGFGGEIGPDLTHERFFGGPAELSALLWNHIPDMNRKYRQLGLRRPSFTESEMLDLMGFLYYLRYLGEPGSALEGQRLLSEKGCLTCHESRGGAASAGPSFDSIEHEISPVNLVQAMWNHIPAMQAEVLDRGMEYPLLEGGEVGDISSYLQLASSHETTIRMSPGNPEEGSRLFETKHCSACHTFGTEPGKLGPDFQPRDLNRSVTEIAGLMWNHGPVMNEFMSSEDVDWPVFEGTEMADLISYLYFLGFQAPPGDTEAGQTVARERQCTVCHKSDGTGPAPDFSSISRPKSLVGLAALMWNHAADMEDLILSRNMDWPQLNEEDTRDLYAFLGGASRED
jgi:cytochrome c2